MGGGEGRKNLERLLKSTPFMHWRPSYVQNLSASLLDSQEWAIKARNRILSISAMRR